MNLKYTTAALVMIILAGCQSRPQHVDIIISDEQFDIPKTDYIREYPQVIYPRMSVPVGSQTLTAANRLADELGVEFVEWSQDLNPYEYHQLRSKRIKLNYSDPQASFLELFDRSGLLAHYNSELNAVTIHPFSMEERVNTPHIFTPKFERSERQSIEAISRYQSDLARRNQAIEYHYYSGFTVKETINAWAEAASLKGVVWFLNSDQQINFVDAALEKNDSTIAATPLSVMTAFINEEMTRQNRQISLSLVIDQERDLLIVHPYSINEPVKAFDIETGSIRHNLRNIADFYGYTLDYRAIDYAVSIPYTTVLTSYAEPSINTVISQYPIEIEVIDSTKRIIVRNKRNG